jgi:hypothetical protein
MLALSVLDQSIACAGRGEDDALRDTLDIAATCERLGFRRFWVSEHHGLPTIVGTAPRDTAGGDRSAHFAHSNRQCRRDAAPLLGVQGRRAVPRAGRPGTRSHRSGRRPSARQRHAGGAVAQSAGRAGRRQLPGAGRGPRGLVPRDPAPGARSRTPWPVWPVWPARTVRGRTHRCARRRSGFWAAPTTAPSWPRTWACPMPLPTSSWTGKVWSRRWRFIAAFTAPVPGILVRRRRSASGRWRQTATNRPDTSRAAVSAGAWTASRAAWGPCRHRNRSASMPWRSNSWAGMRRRALVGNAAQVAQGLRHLAAELSLDEIVINTWAHDPAVRRHSYALRPRRAFESSAPTHAESRQATCWWHPAPSCPPAR